MNASSFCWAEGPLSGLALVSALGSGLVLALASALGAGDVVWPLACTLLVSFPRGSAIRSVSALRSAGAPIWSFSSPVSRSVRSVLKMLV